MILITDLETNGLFDYKNKTGPTVIHCATAIELETDKIHEFEGCGKDYLDLLEKADTVVGHNFVRYDRRVLHRLKKFLIPLNKIHDTLIMSQIMNPKGRGHSLGVWGQELGIAKPEHEDWTKFTPEMMYRCTEDTKINLKLYKKLLVEFETLGFSMNSLQVETVMAELLEQQEENGSPLDVELTRKCFYEVKDRADGLETTISKAFTKLPDSRKSKLFAYKPKYKKDGTLSAVSKKKLAQFGMPEDTCECTLFSWRDFNIDATTFVKEHLLRLGWEPIEFTEKGSPKITEESLENFNLKEAQSLKEYILLRNRQKIFSRWLEEVSDEGSVHSRVFSMGTWTHRCSHTNFMGNPPRLVDKKIGNLSDLEEAKPSLIIPYDDALKDLNEKGKTEVILKGVEGRYGYECRKMWVKPRSYSDIVVVGADASGIQMRAFAHYIKDMDYVQQILSSDIHEYNRELAGLKTRNIAKTFIYMYLLGGGNHKAGVVYQMSVDELEEMKDEVMSGQNQWVREKVLDFGLDYLNIPKTPHNYALAYRGYLTKNQFEDAIPGLKTFKAEAKKKGAHWFEAIDGRKVKVWSAHKTLAAALQSFEACVMKRATISYQTHLTKKGIYYKQHNMVHDEWLTSCERKDADYVGQAMVKAIRNTGVLYNSLCPLDGDYRVGDNWMEVH